jgi:predicted component of type VI protein secretion system
MPTLTVRGGPLTGHTVELRPPLGELIVGRADAGFVIDDSAMSRHHARFELADGRLEVTDLGSANGTFVNGERVVGEMRLRTGDELRLGNSRLTFYVVGDDDTETTAVGEGPPALTRRERELLVALCRPLFAATSFAQPASIRQLAAEMFVTEAAVKFHLANLYEKFDLGERNDNGLSRRVTLANEAIRRRAVTIADLRTGHR